MKTSEDVRATPAGAFSQVSWGALLAGLTFIVGGSWLMFLMGSAIGLGIADGTDMSAFGDGLGIGGILWMLISALLVYFLAAMLTARLAGQPDETVGGLHGVVLWGLGIALTLVMGSWGISGVAGAGASALGGLKNSAGVLATMAADAGQAAGASVEDLISSRVGGDLQQTLKLAASRVLAESQDSQGDRTSAEELRAAVDDIDSETIADAGRDLAAGDVQAARDRLVDATELSEDEVESLMDGLESQLRDLSETEVAQQLEEALSARAEQAAAAVSRLSDGSLSLTEVQETVSQLDADTLAAATKHLIAGDEQAAKDVLLANTRLEESEIDAVVEGARTEVQQMIGEAREEIEQTVESASTYAVAALWGAFVATALGLVAAIVGGSMGAGHAQRLAVIAGKRRVRT